MIESFNGRNYIRSSHYSTILKEDTSLPALPYICVYVLVGPNDDFCDYKIIPKDTLIRKGFLLGHNPKCVTTNNNSSSSDYNDNPFTKELYPDVRAEYTGIHQMGGYRFLSFLVTPFRYDTSAQNLYMCTEMELKINLNKDKKADTSSLLLSPHSAKTILSMVSNPEDMDMLYGSVSQATSPRGNDRPNPPTINDVPLKYLIITCDSLSVEFQRLVAWKISKGIKTQVITVEDIYSNYTGNTNQLKIKNAIKDYYDNSSNNLQYVLFGGDKNIVPVQNCYGKVPNLNITANGPSDIFYACLQNINWDTNGNGKYGEIEDNINIDQNVSVARLPMSNNSEVHACIDRILKYERNPNISNWKNEILMCGVNDDGTCTYNGETVSFSHAASEKMYNDYIANTAWDGSKFRFYDTGTDNPNDADYNVTVDNLQTELSKGYSFVNVNTHGEVPFWFLENGDVYPAESTPITTKGADNLVNSGYSIITTEACHTNNFGVGFSLGETFMRNPNSGIMAYYGSSKEGIGAYGMVGPSEEYNGKMLNYLFSGTHDINIGAVLKDSKSYFSAAVTSPNYNGYRWLYFFMNLLGDPEMPVFTSNPSRYDNVIINHYNNSFIVYPNVERGYHCLMSRLDGGASFYESASDMYPSLSFNLGSSEYLICLSHRGYVPFRSIIGSTVYLQNESLDDNLNVTTDYTYIGSDVASERTEGSVSVENGHSVISSTYGVTIKNDFEVKAGASLRIQNN